MGVVRTLAFLALLSLSCGGGGEKVVANPAASSSASLAPLRPTDTAYRLVISSAACWLGGLWGDAEGEAGVAERRAGTARRCGEVVHTVTGQDDPMKVEALRLIDASITDPLVAKVIELAAADKLDDAHTAAITALSTAVITASREAHAARRAATKVRADIEKIKNDKDKATARERDADKLTADEAAVVPALRASAGLDSLVRFTAEAYAVDAHAIGVLLALARVTAGQDLPKHMKLYTVAPAYTAVFGVPAPQLPDRAKDKLKPGVWLTYVMSVAKSCGHPVAETAKKPKEKEVLAWSGVLAGFADRLRSDQEQIKSAELGDAVKGAVTRLEVRAKEAAERAEKP